MQGRETHLKLPGALKNEVCADRARVRGRSVKLSAGAAGAVDEDSEEQFHCWVDLIHLVTRGLRGVGWQGWGWRGGGHV